MFKFSVGFEGYNHDFRAKIFRNPLSSVFLLFVTTRIRRRSVFPHAWYFLSPWSARSTKKIREYNSLQDTWILISPCTIRVCTCAPCYSQARPTHATHAPALEVSNSVGSGVPPIAFLSGSRSFGNMGQLHYIVKSYTASLVNAPAALMFMWKSTKSPTSHDDSRASRFPTIRLMSRASPKPHQFCSGERQI